jgi:diguanylate cyclase (GGDEF)-like protein
MSGELPPFRPPVEGSLPLGAEFEDAQELSAMEQRLADLTQQLVAVKQALAEKDAAHEELLLKYSGLRTENLGLLEAAHEKDLRIAYLEDENVHDDLTGLYTRKFIERTAELLVSRSESHATRRLGEVAVAHKVTGPHSLVALDIDHFKQINDTYGHLFGNEILSIVGVLMCEQFHRDTDVAARIGGEEFALLLPNTPPQSALTIVNKFRARAYEAGESKGIKLTFSGGIVTLGKEGFIASLALADKALYDAKNDGRDKFYVVPPINYTSN